MEWFKIVNDWAGLLALLIGLILSTIELGRHMKSIKPKKIVKDIKQELRQQKIKKSKGHVSVFYKADESKPEIIRVRNLPKSIKIRGVQKFRKR